MGERNDPRLPGPRFARGNMKKQIPTPGVVVPYATIDPISCAMIMAEAIQARWFYGNEKLK
jgi:hypothetical protein